MQTAIASIIVFGLIIFVHEFGHYIVAKLSNIKVEEFALGMGPKLVSRKWGETLYSLRVFPLGGFCKMYGEVGNEGYKAGSDYDPRRFDQKRPLIRMAVVAGGPLMNFFLASLIFMMIFVNLGIPIGYTTRIGNVNAGSAAEAAGIVAGDTIITVNDRAVDSWEQLVEVIHNSPGKEIKLQLERDGQTLEKRLVPRLDPENKVGLIGVTPKDPKWERLSIISGIKEGIAKTYEYTALTLVGLIDMIRGKVSTNDISGPVGIIQMIDQSTRFGLVYLANLTALISISLGLFNLLPIPALDGSRLIFLLFEAVRGRPVNPNRENLVHLLGFMLLMMFMIFITYRDILKLFG